MELLALLDSVPSGHRLVEQARHSWSAPTLAHLTRHIEMGSLSKTDAVLTRRVDADGHEEIIERDVRITLRESSSALETALDLAHELVHASARPTFNPYDPELTAAEYLAVSIEGKGGEVEALASECEVAMELSTRFQLRSRRCERYRGKRGDIDRDQVREDFYRVGRWYGELSNRLGPFVALFPRLSKRNAVLFSSTGNAPYPVALLDEYDQLSHTACENTRKRADRVQAAPKRRDMHFLSRRCKDVAVTDSAISPESPGRKPANSSSAEAGQ